MQGVTAIVRWISAPPMSPGMAARSGATFGELLWLPPEDRIQAHHRDDFLDRRGHLAPDAQLPAVALCPPQTGDEHVQAGAVDERELGYVDEDSPAGSRDRVEMPLQLIDDGHIEFAAEAEPYVTPLERLGDAEVSRGVWNHDAARLPCRDRPRNGGARLSGCSRRRRVP